ncbi:hypothetical protein [Pseudomonas monteilii]|uniref:hypothetical protein n=1 Tax=Pseudomonas monteilii TaxID=76759 RepID=UPI001E4385BB|nr:hypothetical protein [Pseudomonas monteilii]WJO30978.1 hypothetical protein LU690_18050 [Pseudomonas monteilii]
MSEYAVPDGSKFVPVRFMSPDGTVSKLPPGRPVVIAALRHDPDHGSGPRDIPGVNAMWALIDTGADHNYATPDLIKEIGCPQIGTARVRSASGWFDSTQHLAHILLPEVGKQFETDVYSSPLVDEGTGGQSLIIGVLVIKTGRLVMDFQSDVYRLYVD